MQVALRAIIFNSDCLYEFLYCRFSVDVPCIIQTPHDKNKIKFIFDLRSWKAATFFPPSSSLAGNENVAAPLSLAAHLQAVHNSAPLCLRPDSPQHYLAGMSSPLSGVPSLFSATLAKLTLVSLQPYLIVSFQGWVLSPVSLL